MARQETVSRIGDVITVRTDRFFFRCNVCGGRIRKDEKVLLYLRNIGLATDHVHATDCDATYQRKHLVTATVGPEVLKLPTLKRALAFRHVLDDDREPEGDTRMVEVTPLAKEIKSSHGRYRHNRLDH